MSLYDSNARQTFSQLIRPIDLCMSVSFFLNAISFIYVKTNLYFWSRPYSKQSLL